LPANAQGECGEDQEAGTERTQFKRRKFQEFLLFPLVNE
jgi:hypothetical protein